MTRLSRRHILAGAAGGMAAASFGPFVRTAGAADFSYKLAHVFAATHPIHIRASEAAKQIREQTNGQLSIDIYPGGVLGSDADAINQVRNGAIQFVLNSAANVSFPPSVGITTIAFAFRGYDDIWKAIDGDLGDQIKTEFKNGGFLPLGKGWDIGVRHFSSSKGPINGPEDFRGLKVRAPTSEFYVSFIKALDASPVSIPFPEVYLALQTKVVDASEAPIAVFSSSKFNEVQKYFSLTSHMWTDCWLVGNPRAWDRLPANVKDIAVKAFDEAATKERNDIVESEKTLLETMKTGGLIVNKPDLAPFQDVLKKAGYYKYWRGKFGEPMWGKLEKYVGALT